MDSEDDGFLLRVMSIFNTAPPMQQPNVRLAFGGKVCSIVVGDKIVALVLSTSGSDLFCRLSRSGKGTLPVFAEEDPQLDSRLLQLI